MKLEKVKETLFHKLSMVMLFMEKKSRVQLAVPSDDHAKQKSKKV